MGFKKGFKKVNSRIPLPFFIGVVFIIAAFFINGISLAVATAYRFLGGLFGGIVAALVVAKVRKRKIKK